MQTVRLFHLAAIISLLKANNFPDEFHNKLIKQGMGKGSTNMQKSFFGVTVDKISLKPGEKGTIISHFKFIISYHLSLCVILTMWVASRPTYKHPYLV